MEKKIFMLLGLHLCTEMQLYHIIVFTGIVEVTLMLVILKWRNHYIEKYDFFFQYFSMYYMSYVWFFWEHLTFFSCIFYNTVYLFMIYIMYWYLKNKCKAKWAKKG